MSQTLDEAALHALIERWETLAAEARDQTRLTHASDISRAAYYEGVVRTYHEVSDDLRALLTPAESLASAVPPPEYLRVTEEEAADILRRAGELNVTVCTGFGEGAAGNGARSSRCDVGSSRCGSCSENAAMTAAPAHNPVTATKRATIRSALLRAAAGSGAPIGSSFGINGTGSTNGRAPSARLSFSRMGRIDDSSAAGRC